MYEIQGVNSNAEVCVCVRDAAEREISASIDSEEVKVLLCSRETRSEGESRSRDLNRRRVFPRDVLRPTVSRARERATSILPLLSFRLRA